ncbi:S24 family peptidase [Mucilaginibacter sp. RCC_168]|uniref:LexA family transcriptional regulator n=1 Tax=Mucilaginibacter sp. RCC_168 TaxID=3239221 RepID=UPI0035239F81
MIANIDKSLILNKIKYFYNLASDKDLAEFLDISPPVLANWRKRNTIDYDIIFTKCESMDFNDLVGHESEKFAEPKAEYLLRSDRRLDTQRVPLYDAKAAAGLTKLFAGKPNVIDYITIPNLPKCDGAMYMTGDSMYPLLKSGDIIAYKQVKDIANGIIWGEMYVLSFLIDDEDFTLVKYIQKSDLGSDYIRLVSQNSHHSSKDIPLESITAMALIKASIRFNSMN